MVEPGIEPGTSWLVSETLTTRPRGWSFLLFCYLENGGSRQVGNYHTSFQKFHTWPQHMGNDIRSVTMQLSLGGLLQFQLNKANWRSACQMHAVVHFTLQMTDGGGAKIHSHLTFWHWMSHRCSHGMKCQSAKVCSPKLSCKIFSCDTLVLELFHLKLQATAHITINHCMKQCNLPTITMSRICCRTGRSLHCLTRITTGLQPINCHFNGRIARNLEGIMLGGGHVVVVLCVAHSETINL